jgi:hypothetical protein
MPAICPDPGIEKDMYSFFKSIVLCQRDFAPNVPNLGVQLDLRS